MVLEEVIEKYDREMDRTMRQNLERFAECMMRRSIWPMRTRLLQNRSIKFSYVLIKYILK